MGEFPAFIHAFHSLYVAYRYPPRHIDWRLTTLFSRYLSKHFILPMLNTSDEFGYLRHQLLTTSTATSYDKVTRKSTTNQNHEKKHAKSASTTYRQQRINNRKTSHHSSKA